MKLVLAAACVLGATLSMPAFALAQAPRLQVPRPGAPMPPRDTSARRSEPAVEGTASISGRVVAADTGLPLARATVTAQPMTTGGGVTMFTEAGRIGPTGPRSVSARTDDQGRYTITKLPAGQYGLVARRAGYVDSGFGQASATSMGRRITLEQGAQVGPLDFQLSRGGVITGRVVDEAGEPAERASVRPMRVTRRSGRVRILPAGQQDTTDDLGHYRLYGLSPGEYLVMAEPSNRGRSMFGGGADMQGDAASDAIPTYGPATVSYADAQRVQVQSGMESAMDIQLVSARLARISGRVVSAGGDRLTGGFVRLQADNAEIIGPGYGGPIRPDGSFEVDGVPPGVYTLIAQPTITGNVATSDEMQRRMAALEVGTQSVAVEGEDQVGVVITTTVGSTARGRLIVEGDASALARGDLRINGAPLPDALSMMMMAAAVGRVKPDLSVEIVGLRGEQMLRVSGLPAGWWVKSVVVGGRDALFGFDYASAKTFDDLEVTVSSQPTALNGMVTLPNGGTAADYAVVLFPESEALWERGASVGITRIVRPDLDGSFKAGGLRPGTYYVLAVPAAEADTSLMGDAEQLRDLVQRARTVDVTEGQTQAVTLTLVGR